MEPCLEQKASERASYSFFAPSAIDPPRFQIQQLLRGCGEVGRGAIKNFKAGLLPLFCLSACLGVTSCPRWRMSGCLGGSLEALLACDAEFA